MRVLALVLANGFSSEQRVFASLLAARADRYEPLVLHHAHDGDDGAADEFAREADVEVARIDSGWRPASADRSRAAKALGWAKLHAAIARMIAAGARFRPDVIYSSQQRWDCYAASLVSAALRVPHVVHLHYTVGEWLGRSTLYRLPRVAAVVCVSEYIRGQAVAAGVDKARAHVVHNTVRVAERSWVDRVRVRRELGIPAHAPVAAFVARLAPGKGHDDALRAMAGVGPDAHMLIAGDGPERAAIEARRDALGLRDRVYMLGHRRDVPALLSAADVFVHPSRSEPFGLSILEAAAHGLPTVAYRDGGPCEIVRDGETGRLVDPDDVYALERALNDMLHDRNRALVMGAAARKDVLVRFAPEIHAHRFAEVISALVSRIRGSVAPPPRTQARL